MTKQEAIEVLKNNYPKMCKMVNGRYQGGFDNTESDFGQALTMAISALKEVQQYRKIGSVEECRKAVEKQKPEKPEIYTDTIQTISSSFNRDVYLCSRCGQFIGNIDDELPHYCNFCGQRIDENLEGMEDE